MTSETKSFLNHSLKRKFCTLFPEGEPKVPTQQFAFNCKRQKEVECTRDVSHNSRTAVSTAAKLKTLRDETVTALST